jgi:hypothetical protein
MIGCDTGAMPPIVSAARRSADCKLGGSDFKENWFSCAGDINAWTVTGFHIPAQHFNDCCKTSSSRGSYLAQNIHRRSRDGLFSDLAVGPRGRSGALAGIDVRQCGDRLARPWRKSGYGEFRDAADNGDRCLWRFGPDIGRWPDRVAQAEILRTIQPRRQTQLICGTITVPLGRYSGA